MLRISAWLVAGVAAWIAWCVLAIQWIVPAIQRHLTMYTQVIAIVLCLAPPVIVGVAGLIRAKSTESD